MNLFDMRSSSYLCLIIPAYNYVYCELDYVKQFQDTQFLVLTVINVAKLSQGSSDYHFTLNSGRTAVKHAQPPVGSYRFNWCILKRIFLWSFKALGFFWLSKFFEKNFCRSNFQDFGGGAKLSSSKAVWLDKVLTFWQVKIMRF